MQGTSTDEVTGQNFSRNDAATKIRYISLIAFCFLLSGLLEYPFEDERESAGCPVRRPRSSM